MAKKKFKVGDQVVIDASEFGEPIEGWVSNIDKNGNVEVTGPVRDDGVAERYWTTGQHITHIDAFYAPSDPVSHPSHYQHPSGIEVIKITRHESFLRGNIIKYVMRAPFKGSEVQDLKKAQQYLQWEIERVEAEGD